jgi:hypothetical protein
MFAAPLAHWPSHDWGRDDPVSKVGPMFHLRAFVRRTALAAVCVSLLAIPVAGAQAAGSSAGKAKVDTSTVGKQPAGTGVGRKGH